MGGPSPATRTRKPSMAEVMGIGYALSSNDFADMYKEVGCTTRNCCRNNGLLTKLSSPNGFVCLKDSN